MAETLILTLAIMYAWFMTVWTSNWLDGERQEVRLLLLGPMFASLLMSTLITYAGVIASHPLPGRQSPFRTDTTTACSSSP